MQARQYVLVNVYFHMAFFVCGGLKLNIDGSHELFVIVLWKISRCCVICPLAAQIQQKDYSHIYYDIFHDGKLRAHVVC